MVVIYIEATKPDETFWFKNPIEGSTISLLSCSFTNEMCNLLSEGTFTVGGKVNLRIPRGNYNARSLKDVIEKTDLEIDDDSNSISNKVSKVRPVRITFSNEIASLTSTVAGVKMNDSLVKLLNIKDSEKVLTMKGQSVVINIVQPPRAILIHCDLVDFTQVMFGNDYKQLLSIIDVGDCGSQVRYPHAAAIQSTMKRGGYISNMRLRITDNKNNVVTDGVYPMILAIEIT